MNGLVYLLDQAGLALQQANAHIARLEAELAVLRADDEPPITD